MVQPYNTTVSSVIVYQCQQPGFTPTPPDSVCDENGTWSPNPTQVVCMMITTTLAPSPGTVGEYGYRMTIEYWVYCITGASPFWIEIFADAHGWMEYRSIPECFVFEKLL